MARQSARVGADLFPEAGQRPTLRLSLRTILGVQQHDDGLVLRGLVVTEEGKKGLRGRIERYLSRRIARPDFLAYDVRDFPSRFAGRQRAAGMPVLTWTVRTQADRAAAAANADQIIYEVPA